MNLFFLLGTLVALLSLISNTQSNTTYNPLWKPVSSQERSSILSEMLPNSTITDEGLGLSDFGSFGRKIEKLKESEVDPIDQFLKNNSDEFAVEEKTIKSSKSKPSIGDSRKRLRSLLNEFLVSQRQLDFTTLVSLPSPARLDEIQDFLQNRLSFYRYNPVINQTGEFDWKISLPAWVNLQFLGRKLERQAFREFQLTWKYQSREKSQILSAVIALDHQKELNLKFEKPHPRAKVSIIIDDMGHMGRGFKIYRNMGHPMTMSFLPFYETSEMQSKIAYEEGFELMLHMPMQPNHKLYFRSPLVIETNLTESEVRSRVRGNLEKLPLVVGFNNHQGSKATRDLNLMRIVMDEVSKHKRLYFIDSVTSGSTKAHMAALEVGFSSRKRNSDFLDNTKTHEAITAKIKELIQGAKNSRGVRIAIIHESKVSANAINQLLPRFESLGIEIVSPSDFLEPNLL